jgi:hypothetical protein
LLALLAVNETGEALDAVGDIIPDLPVGKGKTPSPPESFVADFFLRNPMVCFGSQKNVGCNRRLLNINLHISVMLTVGRKKHLFCLR